MSVSRRPTKYSTIMKAAADNMLWLIVPGTMAGRMWW
jgi:hypothetical protein